MIIRESDIDFDEMRGKCSPHAVEDALGHVEAAQELLAPLREGYAEGTSPELLRALIVVRNALSDALDGA